MDTGQKIYREDIKSLRIYNPADILAPPVINLHSKNGLEVNFDILSEDAEYLKYRLVHCNADWQPSSLIESEYLDGFNEVPIEDYAFSSNTYVHYVNYNISLPDPSLPIKKSSNYLLQVFPENDPQTILLQVRFSVTEDNASTYGLVSTRTDKGVNTEYQQIYCNIDFSNLGNINPYQDIMVSIIQNNRPETQRIIRNPGRIESSKIFFEHNPLLIFEAGNEYRRFETVRPDYPGMNIDSVKFKDGVWNAWIKHDFSRDHKDYSFDKTQNGRFTIDDYNSTDPNLGADYINVHFTLNPEEYIQGKIFIDGELTNHNFDETNRMLYDANDGLFHQSLLLKQGSYNYQYVVINDDGTLPSNRQIEGNKYETNNEYLIQFFLRTPTDRADRLISSSILRP